MKDAGLRTNSKHLMTVIGVTGRKMREDHQLQVLAKVTHDGKLLSPRTTQSAGSHTQLLWGLPGWKKALRVKRAFDAAHRSRRKPRERKPSEQIEEGRGGEV